MSVLKGNISSVLRKRDNTLLDDLRQGINQQAQLRAGQLADAKAALTSAGSSADADLQLALAKTQTPDEVQNVLDTQLGMFADRGKAAQVGNQQLQNLLNRDSTRITNLTKDLANRNVLENWENKQTIKKELGELGQFTPGTPQYKAKLEEVHQTNLARGIPDKAITDIYNQEFNTADITVMPETIQAALGEGIDITNPDNFGITAQNRALSTISDKLEQQWTGIRDKSVFDTKAKDLLSKSQWGQNFARQTALEAGETTQGVRLRGFAQNIGQAVNLAAQTGNTADVDRNINEMLTYARQNNITGEALAPFNEFINIALERTVTDPVALFNEVNPNSEFTTSNGRIPYVTPVEANKLKNKLTERYREKFPNLSDKYLQARIQQDFRKNGNLAFAIQRGEELIKFGSKVRADEMKQSAEFKANQTGVLLNMRREGRKGFIVNKLHEKLSKFMDPDSNDYKKIIDQSGKVIDKFKMLFTVKKGPYAGTFTLAGTPAEEAFNLAINRAILGQAALRKDIFTPSDLTIGTSSQDADKLSDQALMKLFIEALPKSSASVSNLDLGNNESVNVVEGIQDLKGLATDKKAQLDKTGTISNAEWWDQLKDGNLEFNLNNYRNIKSALGFNN